MKKNPIFVLNWKMNLLPSQEELLCHQLTQYLPANKVSLVICPSFLSIAQCSQIIKNSKSSISLGSQDCSEHEQGNFTAQTSAKASAQAGCRYSIVDHYETRIANHFSEQNILSKAKMAIQASITPIICLGADSDEDEALKAQIKPYFELLSQTTKHIIFAYEPSMAIGSANSANIEDIKRVTDQIRLISRDYSGKTSILYGGSVNAQNIVQIYKLESVDGFLIGNAGLNFQEIKKMLESLL